MLIREALHHCSLTAIILLDGVKQMKLPVATHDTMNSHQNASHQGLSMRISPLIVGADMETLRVRGRLFTADQIEMIKRTVLTNFEEGRTKISHYICQALGWTQLNGRLKDVACREVLRRLEEAGFIKLPARRSNGAVWRTEPVTKKYDGDTAPITVIDFRKLNFHIADSKEDYCLWNTLVSNYHYLQTSRIVGRQLKYLVYHEDKPVACLGWGDSAWALRARDEWIGWTWEDRALYRHLIINNVRFLILPWVRVDNLASHLLSRCGESVVRDWKIKYGFKPVLLETFVDIQRFAGTCYKAANWTKLGVSSGYAKVGRSHHNSQIPKALFVYPVHKRCRNVLRGERQQ